MKNSHNQFPYSRSARALTLIASALLLSSAAHAQQLLWDGGGSTTDDPGRDGSGTWDQSTANWYQYSPTLKTWTDGSTAVIGNGGAAGTITLGAPVTVGNIYFQAVGSGSYAIVPDANNDPLTFNTNGFPQVQIPAGTSATLSCPTIGGFAFNGPGTVTLNVTTTGPDSGNIINNTGTLIIIGGSTGNYGAGLLTLNNGANLVVSDNLQGAGHESVSNVFMQGGWLMSSATGGSVGGIAGYSLNFMPGGSNSFGVLQIDGDSDQSYRSPVFDLDLNTASAAIGTPGTSCTNDYVNFTGNITGFPLNSLTFNLNFIGAQPANGTQMTYTVLNYGGPLGTQPPAINTTGASVTSTQFGTNGTQYTITVTFGPPATVGVTCPANITVNDDGSGTGAIVNFQATPTGGCSTPNVVAVPASGSRFPIGTTTVNVTASDTCNNTANCSFTVTVNSANGQPTLAIVNNGDGSATLSYNAIGGTTYDIQYATSLTAPVSWTTIPAGNTNPANSGPVSFTDPNTSTTANAASGQIFYRTVSP